VTGDTVAGEAQRAFIENSQTEAFRYDLILTSPAVGTGVDITFPENAQVIDVVFGFGEANVNTHFDIDQQIGRVRHPGAVRVWLDNRRMHFETSVDAVRRELLNKGMYKNLLIDWSGPGGSARYIEDDPLIEMAALIVAQQRASMNTLRVNYVAYKQAQGYEIEFERARDEQGIGGQLLKLGKDMRDATYAERICAAPPLRWPDFKRNKEMLEGGRVAADHILWSIERTKVELFYRQAISHGLVKVDDRARYRHAIMRFEAVERATATNDVSSLKDEPLPHAAKFIRTHTDTAVAIARLLQLTPLRRGTGWRCDAIFDGDQLSDFVRFCKDNKAALENLLKIEIRGDLESKPISQLSAVLRLIGLNLAKAGTTKSAGKKIYRYRLDEGALLQIRVVQADRQRVTAWRFMAGLHGWPDDAHGEDFDDAA
jgi:hypothetical protein